MDQALNFILFDKHKLTSGVFWSVILVGIFVVWVYITFSFFLKI